MNDLVRDLSERIFDHPHPPCLSLFMPTHRRHPENQQDPIRYRNLVREIEDSLERAEPLGGSRSDTLEKFHGLAADAEFWNHAHDGLAVLGSPGFFRVYKLQRPVPEIVVVADSFHIKPLLRIAQSADRFHILALTLRDARLYEGTRDAVDLVELDESFPSTITKALGEELTEPHQTVASYGGASPSQPAMHHGHGSKETEAEIDAKRYFRVVDRAVAENYSKPGKVPLLLATLPEHRGLFQQITHNPLLLEAGIPVHPDSLSADELRTSAWQAVEPIYRARLAALIEEYGNSCVRGLGHSDIAEIARAAASGRVATVLIDADRIEPGVLDQNSGAVSLGEIDGQNVGDLLDDLGELVMRMGGEVVVVPRQDMPTDTGAAAIYRY